MKQPERTLWYTSRTSIAWNSPRASLTYTTSCCVNETRNANRCWESLSMTYDVGIGFIRNIAHHQRAGRLGGEAASSATWWKPAVRGHVLL